MLPLTASEPNGNLKLERAVRPGRISVAIPLDAVYNTSVPRALRDAAIVDSVNVFSCSRWSIDHQYTTLVLYDAGCNGIKNGSLLLA